MKALTLITISMFIALGMMANDGVQSKELKERVYVKANADSKVIVVSQDEFENQSIRIYAPSGSLVYSKPQSVSETEVKELPITEEGDYWLVSSKDGAVTMMKL